MAEPPKVAIVFVTYARTEYAVRTVLGLRKHLICPYELGWYVADDGSRTAHYKAVMNALEGAPIIGSHSQNFITGKCWPGKSWNKAWRFAHGWTPIILWIEDDWELQRDLDITPYVKLLVEREDVGMVRLGHLAVDLNTRSVAHDGIHYLKMLRNMPYGYSGNPHLKHVRFVRTYGFYKENIGPGDTELHYDFKFTSKEGPDIWWPVDIGGWGIFKHIGKVQSYQ